MEYEVKDIQTVTIETSTGKEIIVAVMVEFRDVDFKNITTLKFDSLATDTDIQNAIISYGENLKTIVQQNYNFPKAGTI
jgi:hypothetical protein